MLVLTRYSGQSIKIITPKKELIEVQVKSLYQNPASGVMRSQIAINAPKDYVILRSEIYVDGQEALNSSQVKALP